jgi:hypothetical protein
MLFDRGRTLGMLGVEYTNNKTEILVTSWPHIVV